MKTFKIKITDMVYNVLKTVKIKAVSKFEAEQKIHSYIVRNQEKFPTAFYSIFL